ncbi:MAG TPA: hypothetical protein PK040_01200 [Anaerolineaceae bacterium]|jgi:hypothetical protein|nr:hypothetical protein [Anaerolineaceae bacterium]
MTIENIATLRIAGYTIEMDGRDSDVKIAVPLLHQQFLLKPDHHHETQEEHHLLLQVKDQDEVQIKESDLPLCRTDIWELWGRNQKEYIFVSPRQTPPRYVVVDRDFTHGVVSGDFLRTTADPVYPLGSIDIRIMVNWLAQTGDVLLHAAGISVQGNGYCFIGQSGAGKSTLMANLPQDDRLTILGEDQVILRKQGEAFWIYGTPWHEHADRCSPLGVPLRKVFFLDRTQQEPLIPVAKMECVAKILNTAFIPYYLPDVIPLILDNLARLSDIIPVYHLKYVIGSDVLSLILGD